MLITGCERRDDEFEEQYQNDLCPSLKLLNG